MAATLYTYITYVYSGRDAAFHMSYRHITVKTKTLVLGINNARDNHIFIKKS